MPERAGWRVEINEAFAAIAVALVRELGLDEDYRQRRRRRHRPLLGNALWHSKDPRQYAAAFSIASRKVAPGLLAVASSKTDP